MNDMAAGNAGNSGDVIKLIRNQVAAGSVRVTQHAQQEMVDEEVTLDDVLEALENGELLENYPEHKRGPCCLVYGRTNSGRSLHVVCTSSLPVLVVITVYEPLPPKWVTPKQRRTKP